MELLYLQHQKHYSRTRTALITPCRPFLHSKTGCILSGKLKRPKKIKPPSRNTRKLDMITLLFSKTLNYQSLCTSRIASAIAAIVPTIIRNTDSGSHFLSRKRKTITIIIAISISFLLNNIFTSFYIPFYAKRWIITPANTIKNTIPIPVIITNTTAL